MTLSIFILGVVIALIFSSNIYHTCTLIKQELVQQQTPSLMKLQEALLEITPAEST